MELVPTLTCPCRPGFIYASKQALTTHRKTQRHSIWEGRTKTDNMDATKRDNELFTLRLKLNDREEAIEKLNSKVIDLHCKNNKLSEENKILKKGLKKLMTPSAEPPLIEF
jgi:septal ring factor EnvC (AmiA/AmiB activator)